MKKIAAFLWAIILVAAICGCSHAAPEPTPEPTPEPAASQEECDEIAFTIQRVCESDVSVSAYCHGQDIDIYVTIDPIILKYQFAINLDASLPVAKDALEERGFSLGEFSVIGAYYENGEKSTSISWVSEDFETGFFVDAKNGGVIPNATVDKVFEYCEYPE